LSVYIGPDRYRETLFLKLTLTVFLVFVDYIPQLSDGSRVVIVDGDDETINEKD